MNRKINKIFIGLIAVFALIHLAPKKYNLVFADTNTETITFTNADWNNTENVELLISNPGNSFYNGGVKVQQDRSGVFVKTNLTYEEVNHISVNYATNDDKGAGSIEVYVGDNLIGNNAVDYTSGGLTYRNSEFVVSEKSGRVKVSFYCTVSSLYIHSITIKYNGEAKLVEEEDSDPTTPTGVDYTKSLQPTYSGNYYNSVNTNVKGEQLLKNLAAKISSGTVDVGYNGLKTAYKTTDMQPNKQYIWDMYSNEEYVWTTDMSGGFGYEGAGYNREHIVPQSWFNKSAPMVSDLWNVVPTDGYVNNARGNYPHGDVKEATYTSGNGSTRGVSANQYYKGIVFEVIDEYKGDFARHYLYMATRYYDKLSTWGSGAGDVFKGSWPYLTNFAINQYLTWSLIDPVSEKEINRNNAVESIQKNRNPFVDNPMWVFDIWGEQSAAPDIGNVGGGGNDNPPTPIVPDPPTPIDPEPPVNPEPEHNPAVGNAFKTLTAKTGMICEFEVKNMTVTVNELKLTYRIDYQVAMFDSLNGIHYTLGLFLIDDASKLENVSNSSELSQLSSYSELYKINDPNGGKLYGTNKLNANTLDTVYTVCAFLEYDSHIYFSKTSTYSAKTMATKLLELNHYDSIAKEYVGLNAILGNTQIGGATI